MVLLFLTINVIWINCLMFSKVLNESQEKSPKMNHLQKVNTFLFGSLRATTCQKAKHLL